MNTTIDGFNLLQAIGKHPDVFVELRAEIRKVSTALLKKHLKSPSLKVDRFRLIGSAVSVDVLLLILEELNDKELRALTKKLDQHFQDLTSANDAQLRRHLRALAVSEIEPSPKTRKVSEKSKPSSAPPAAKEKSGAHWAESMAAKPSRYRK